MIMMPTADAGNRCSSQGTQTSGTPQAAPSCAVAFDSTPAPGIPAPTVPLGEWPRRAGSGSLLLMTSPGAPAWFTDVLANKAQERRITVEETPVAYRAWEDPADRSIVLIHGGAAHSR